MQRFNKFSRTALVVVLAGCVADAGNPLAPGADPLLAIADAAHSGSVPGFYFLPPMVKAPSYSGTFDAVLSPRVEVCELAGTSCGTVLRTFTMGSGSTGIRVSAADEHYIVNWHSPKSLSPSATYRVSVFSGGFRLGYADVKAVANGGAAKGIDRSQFVVVKAGSTLPIKFRIEAGIVAEVVVSPDSADVPVGGTQQFTAALVDLHGNAIAGPPVAWSSSDEAVATIDSDGLATALAVGATTITATAQAASGTAVLTVFNPNQPPVASADTADAIGNFTVPVSSPGVLANDTDPDGNPLSAVAGTFATAQGGTFTLSADGSFTYLSPAGFTGEDEAAYEITDGLATATSTITFVAPTRVWYVDNAAAAPGDGRDASPFTALKAAESVSAAGETIFVLAGDGTSTGLDAGIVLKNGQALTGQGVSANVTASLNGESVVLLAAGSAPALTRAIPGATVALAVDNTVQGVDVRSTDGAGFTGGNFGTLTVGATSVAAAGGPSLELANGTVAASFGSLSSAGSASAGLRLVNVLGTLDAPGGSIVGAAGTGVEVSGGSANVSYGGDVASVGPRPVAIAGRTGGTLTLSGTIASTGQGILVQGNGGGTVAFTGASKSLSTGANHGIELAGNAGAAVQFAGGGLAIATTTGGAFQATGGGTVTVTGAGNSLASAGGVALRVENTTIGAAGLSFRSISAAGGANGIVLVNTGASNGVQVTGNGTPGSGGSIANTAGPNGTPAGNGIYLREVRNVSLSWMAVSGTENNGLYGVGVRGLRLDHVRFTGTIGNSGADRESPVHLEDVGGAVRLASSRFDGGAQHGVYVRNAMGTAPGLDSLVIENDSVSHVQGSSSDVRGSAIRVDLEDGTGDVRIRDNHLTYWWENAVYVRAQGTASATVRITGNTAHQTSGALAGAGGIWVSGGNLAYRIAGNSVRFTNGTAISAARVSAGAHMQGTIENNAIGASGVANSGSMAGSGIFASHHGPGTTTLRIRGNTVRQINGNAGINLVTGDASAFGGSGRIRATVVGNDLQEEGTTVSNSRWALIVSHGISSGPPADGDVGCYDIGGGSAALRNVVTNWNTSATVASRVNAMRVSQRFATTSHWPGYTGAQTGSASAADMHAYLVSRNTIDHTLNSNSSSGGFNDTTPAGSSCPQPAL